MSSHLSPQQMNLKKLLQLFLQSQSVANVVAVYTGASVVCTGASAVVARLAKVVESAVLGLCTHTE